MTRMTKRLRERIRQRAGKRCEYCLCHQDYVFGQLQIDHVIPLAKGGRDTEENLCLACELCNQHKWTKTEEIDPLTGQNVPLFHPRKQRWSDHFTWGEDGTIILGSHRISDMRTHRSGRNSRTTADGRNLRRVGRRGTEPCL